MRSHKTTAIDRHREEMQRFKWGAPNCYDTETAAVRYYRCDALQLACIVTTPRVKWGFGDAVITFEVDGVDGVFDTPEEAVACLENIGVLPRPKKNVREAGL